MLQNILSIITATNMIVETCYTYHVYRPLSYIGIISYFVYDAICNDVNYEYIIHHTTTISGIIICYIWPYPDEVFTTVGRVEISTIIMNVIPFTNSKFKTPLQLLFYITFVKYRIYDWYYMFQEYKLLYVHYIPLIILYTLNLYWFTLLTKKLGKIFLKPYNLKPLQHQICSYTMAINSCITVYTVYPNYVYGQITCCFLALTSYLYHQNIIKNHNSITPKTPKWILYDITAIHLFEVSYMYTICDYWYILATVHILNILYIYNTIPDDYITSSMPSFLLDAIVTIYIKPSIEIYTICVLQICGQFIQPLYDLTFSYIHLLMMLYTYYCITSVVFNL